MKRIMHVLIVVTLVLAVATSVSADSYPAPYFNGFENPDDVSTDGSYPSDDAMYFVTRVPSGTNGITSAAGDWHAEAAVTNFGAPDGYVFTRYGGYNSVFPQYGYTTSIDST